MLFRISLNILRVTTISIAWIDSAVQNRVDFIIVPDVILCDHVVVVVSSDIYRMSSITCTII